MTIDAQRVAELLGGERTLKSNVRTVDELRRLVEGGLPTRTLQLVVQRVAGKGRLAREIKFQIVPRTTLQRRKTRLSVRESEHVERLARMTVLAEVVWENPELAHEFLTSAQPQLGGERPVDLARGDLGTRQVEQLLQRIEYALPA